MITIQDRFKRAYQVLVDLYNKDNTYARELIAEDSLSLMWLRNEAKLWQDYEEDMTMVIDGVNMDPNHPDNLSAYVWQCFKTSYQYA